MSCKEYILCVPTLLASTRRLFAGFRIQPHLTFIIETDQSLSAANHMSKKLRGFPLLFSAAITTAFLVAGCLTGYLSYLLGAAAVPLVALCLCRHFARRTDELLDAHALEVRRSEELAELRMKAIESLATAIESKDQTTHDHVRRTQTYAVELGKRMKVSASEIEALKAGALLHDIGKLAVPDYILNKPGKLTTSEFEKMKVHTEVGADIIRRVNFPYPVEDIARFHHEKWDGTGYPLGLKGEQIPLVARIIAVVDFYDVIRCDRPYRAGMSRKESLSLLQRMAGRSFDPKVVDEFVANIDHFDSLISESDRVGQVPTFETLAVREVSSEKEPSASHKSNDQNAGFRSIAEAQREVSALHEIAQTVGGSLNLSDIASLVTNKLQAIVPFDVCVISLLDEKEEKAVPVHTHGEHSDYFSTRAVFIGKGITGWVIANGRPMLSGSPELDLASAPEEVAHALRSVLAAPLLREEGAFGAITLYTTERAGFTNEHTRLLESVCLHASSALNNALMFERTKESALTDALTGLPNSRALHLMLEQRLAECRRYGRDPVTVLSLDVDDFASINDDYGHGVGDRVLANLAVTIKQQLRQMDVVARYAGDEFVAVLPMTSAEVATMVSERIRSAVEAQDFTVRTGRTTHLRVSIGMATYPIGGETADEMLLTATRNMQRNKQARKHSPVVLFPKDDMVVDPFR